MKQGIRTGLIALVFIALATGVGVAAANLVSASDGASVSGSVEDQYGGASVQAGAQAQVGGIVVQGAIAASYNGRGWRGGTLSHCAKSKKMSKRKRRACLRARRKLRKSLARGVRRASVERAVMASTRSPFCTLPGGCAASAPIGVGGSSPRVIRVASAKAAPRRAAQVTSREPIGLLVVAGGALAALALATTARRTLRRVRSVRASR